jgi:hypothetical protein
MSSELKANALGRKIILRSSNGLPKPMSYENVASKALLQIHAFIFA